jgi:hypothetical protein
MLQLRAIFAAPFLPPTTPGHTLFIAQMTDRGSERGREESPAFFARTAIY